MSYIVDVLSDLPVVFSRPLSGFEMVRDQGPLQLDVRAALEAAAEPLYYIVDLSHTDLDFSAVLQGSNQGARNENSPWRHPKIHQVIFVSHQEVIHHAVAGMDSAAFGHFKAVTFHTFEEALAHIRSMSKAN